MPSNRVHSYAYWAVAVAIGSLLNSALFLAMPHLGQRPSSPSPPTIEVAFSAWRAPSNTVPPTPTPPSKVAPKPVEPKPQTKTGPEPPVEKRLVRDATPPLTNPPPPPHPEPLPEPPSTERQEPSDVANAAAVTQDSTVPEPRAELLAKPVPLFQLTRMPQFVHRATPVYPLEMKTQAIEAVVKLEVLIDSDGKIRRIDVLESAGAAFDAAAVAALRASSFTPGQVNEQTVAVLMRLPVRFKLR